MLIRNGLVDQKEWSREKDNYNWFHPFKAEEEPTDRVCLWLGANVMLEYTNREAEELLTKNLTQATASMDQTQIDLDFLKFLFLFS